MAQAPLLQQRGFFFFAGAGHLSVSFADSRTVAAKRFPAPDGAANRAGFPLKGEPPLEGKWHGVSRDGEVTHFRLKK